jgi:hypothetical protein
VATIALVICIAAIVVCLLSFIFSMIAHQQYSSRQNKAFYVLAMLWFLSLLVAIVSGGVSAIAHVLA